MIVLDASAIVQALTTAGESRELMASGALATSHLADAEVPQALRRHVLVGHLDAQVARTTLATWQELGVVRHPSAGLFGRIWELCHNLSAYDATYVALAESLEAPLVTADRRLARAPGIECEAVLVSS